MIEIAQGKESNVALMEKEKEEELKRQLGDEYCPERDDNIHCRCWYDGDGCCACNASPMTAKEKQEQGME